MHQLLKNIPNWIIHGKFGNYIRWVTWPVWRFNKIRNNFAILSYSRNSQRFDVREKCLFYRMQAAKATKHQRTSRCEMICETRTTGSAYNGCWLHNPAFVSSQLCFSKTAFFTFSISAISMWSYFSSYNTTMVVCIVHRELSLPVREYP